MIAQSKSEFIATRFGASLEQVAALHKKNAAGLAQMAAKSAGKGKKVNGYTAAQLRKFAQASELRAEWTEMLAHNEQLRSGPETPENTKWLDRDRDNVRALLASLDAPAAVGPRFQMKLASVGNPDRGQYHREGVASPTILVEADSLATLVTVHNAYVAVYDLGGGNMAKGTGDVYRDGALVATISYNGRVWTPFEFGDPRHAEIDPATGNVRAA